MYFRRKFFIFLLLFILNNSYVQSEDLSIIINVRKSLHIVSDQFISFCVDPAYFFNNVNFSANGFNIISALSPAFIRLSGPSTKILTWVDPNKSSQAKRHILPNLFELTPNQWIDFNEWAVNTNLTPIFALNDRHRINGVWDPRDSLALMTLTDQMGYSCFWELGYECRNTSLSQYVSDLTSLQHILDAFPASKDYWGTIGSDFSGCFNKPNLERIRNFLLGVEHSLDAINWHLKNETNHLSEKDPIVKALMPSTKTNLPVMLTVPAVDNSATFRNGLEWALQMGNAAKYGFGVIFKQPTNMELFMETPVFWISLFHKNLLGKNVLDVRTSNINKTVSQVYCHCTRRQNKYIRRGAVTLFAVNPENSNMSASVRIFLNPMKSVEIQSYILTSNGDIDDSEIFLNDEKLTYDSVIKYGKLELIPKIRRVRINRALSLHLPPYSIGYFVLPGARSSACIIGEDDHDLIVEEIIEDQNLGNIVSITDNYEEHDVATKMDDKEERWDKVMSTRPKENEKHKNDASDTTRQYLINRAKLAEKHRAQVEAEQQKLQLRHKLMETLRNGKQEDEKTSLESIELTSEEIKLILSERKRKRQARHKRFLPIELIKDFAEKNKKEKNTVIENDEKESEDKAGNRAKREIDHERFARRRAARLERLGKKKEDLEAEIYTNINPYDTGINGPTNPVPSPIDSPFKPIKVTAQADVFADLAADNGKNTDYDYLETEEEGMDKNFNFGEDRGRFQSRLGNRRNKGGREGKPGIKDGKFIDALTFHTFGGDDQNEWSIMDGDEQLFHTPHEVFEKVNDGTFDWDVKDDWKDYGELFEVDSLKDSVESGEFGDDNMYLEDYVASNEEFQEQQSSNHIVSPYPYQTLQNIEEPRGYPAEELRAQDSQIREVRVRPHPNYFEQQMANKTAKNYNYFEQQMNQRNKTTQEERFYDNTLPSSIPNYSQRRRQQRPTELETTTTTTTTTTPFPLFTSPKPRRRRPRPQDDIPEYMRFKRDISYIQKIPPKNSKTDHRPNNIQTIVQKNTKNSDKFKKLKRDRRDVSQEEENTFVPEQEQVISDKSLDTQASQEANLPSSFVAKEIQTVSPDFEMASTIFPSENLENMNEESSTMNVFQDVELEDEDFLEHFKYVIGKPFDVAKLKPINEKKVNNFQRYLKNRLSRQRKKLEKKNGSKVKDADRNETSSQNELTATPVELTSPLPPSDTQDIIEKLEENQEIEETHKSEIKKRNFSPDTPLFKRSLKSKNNKIKRSVPYDQYFLPSERENEIFGDSHEHFERNSHKYGNYVYKIDTPNGKQIIHINNGHSPEKTGSNFQDPQEETILLLSTNPPNVKMEEDSWSDEESENNSRDMYVKKYDESFGNSFAESNNSDKDRNDSTNEEDNKSIDSWDMSDDSDEDEDQHKKIFIVGGQSFANRASQLFGNLIETLSNVIGRVHRRLSGYFTVLQ